MAQVEDTDLSDLVIEALEKNGSLAKIRALLRANIFLAFEEDYENIKQNISLDNVLKTPEGILSLSLVYEFLEFCNLKNTLFVYMSESRQGKEYTYEGQKSLIDKLKLSVENVKEPVIVTLVKNILKYYTRKHFHHMELESVSKHRKCDNCKDDQNCTYIVHEDSTSSASQSQSDNSSDEKNKLHLRLQLDNSDTDTSSDSARDKSSSEYIPNQHIVHTETAADIRGKSVLHNPIDLSDSDNNKKTADCNDENQQKSASYMHMKLKNNDKINTILYLDMQSYNPLEAKLMNTAGVPVVGDFNTDSSHIIDLNHQSKLSRNDSESLSTCSKSLSVSNNENIEVRKGDKNLSKESNRSDLETAAYSLDFTSPPISESKELSIKNSQSLKNQEGKFSLVESYHHNSQSSQSSVSLSDVADLIEYSDKSIVSAKGNTTKNDSLDQNNSKLIQSDKSKNDGNKLGLDDSGDFSGSSVPSLSNLSLEIHSD